MVSFNHRDRAAFAKKASQNTEGRHRVGQVLEEKADEDVVKALFAERRLEDVRRDQIHVRDAGPFQQLRRFRDRIG